jgi:hypothetical protein
MPTYLVNSCLDDAQYTVESSLVFQLDDIVSFYIDIESMLCGVIVTEITPEPTEYQVNGPHTDCCTCYTDSGYQSFVFTACSVDETFYVDITEFCNLYGSNPLLNEVFKIYDEINDVSYCAQFIGVSVEPPNSVYQVDSGEGPFQTCEECPDTDIPRSANTESTVCEICCDCGATGSTINIITPPHPVWTDGYGTAVTQLNMIVIGGNGLNA